MGLAYLFALVVGLGTLLLQVAMGAKGGGDGHGDGDGDHAGDADELEAEGDGSKELSVGTKDLAVGTKDLGIGGKDLQHDGETSALALFLSTRFWIFASLAFGMSGGLIHVFALAGTITTFIIAALSGFASGLFAVLVFQAIKRSSTPTSPSSSDAIGQIGRVLVTCKRGGMGKVRVELRGHSVDMLATTDDTEIRRGEQILIEDVDGHTARVSRRPPELE
jgi:membrane protein implicated in regulation of membrane protease activity